MNAYYKADYTSNMAGGLRNSASVVDNIDLVLETDFEKLLGLKGLSLTLYGISNHGQNPAEYIGDTYWTSNIAAPTTTKLFEAYFKQNIDDRFSIIAGMRDLNADFYALDSSKTLINSAFGISQTLAQTSGNPFGPSIFPQASVALTAKYESPSSFYFQSGAFNAKSGNPEKNEGTHVNTTADEGYLFIWEAGAADAESELPFKYSVGSWTYTKPTDAIDSETREPDNNYGFYVMADQAVSNHISLFVKYGSASTKINQISQATEGGILIHSLIPSLNSDKLSIGFIQGIASPDWQRINDTKSQESVLEIGYRLEFQRGIAVTPDFQYISNPGLSKTVQDAQVGVFRLEVAF